MHLHREESKKRKEIQTKITTKSNMQLHRKTLQSNKQAKKRSELIFI